MTLEAEKQALFEKIDYVRDRISELIDGVDPNLVIHSASGWRLCDLLAHITSWQREAVAAGLAHVAGQPEIPRQNVMAFNEASYKQWQSLSQQQIYADWLSVYEELKDVVRRAPAETWQEEFVYSWGQQGTLATLVRSILSHDAEHVAEIQRALNE